MAACSDWTEPESANPTDMVKSIKTETYYANLRAYKARKHAVTYAKWAGWTGTGSVLNTQLIGLPDSLDIVGLIRGYEDMTEDKRTDLLAVQQNKGTKVVLTVPTEDLLDGLFSGGSAEEAEAFVQEVAKIVDECGLDGVDIELNQIDEEATASPESTQWLEALAGALTSRFGPSSNTGKLLLFSGNPAYLPAALAPAFNYLVTYAFGSATDQALDEKFLSLAEHFASVYTPEDLAQHLILMEDFEANTNGGVLFKDRFANTMFSLEGMARWLPVIGGHQADKGGVGVYHLEKEYIMEGQASTYPFTHNAIQILNPSIK